MKLGRRLGAGAGVLAFGAVSLLATAAPSMAATSLTLQQDQADVSLKISQRLGRLDGLAKSVGSSHYLSAGQRELLQLGLASTIDKLGTLTLKVTSDTTVDAVEADRATMTSYRVNQVLVPQGQFVIRGMRMQNRMSASAASLRAARTHTNSAADAQLTKAAAALDNVVLYTKRAVADASKVTAAAARDGATPFTVANTDWGNAISALTKARTYLDAAQKADRTSPIDAVIRPAEIKPATPLFDTP